MTTGASNGSVNGMHSSLMPLGGGIAMFLMHLGEILPGGIGSGIAIMVVMAVLSVFVAGLMVGRTPEYLGKKIEAREVQLSILAVVAIPVSTLGFSAIAAVLPEALKGLMHAGPHGLSEILYAYTSATANNGSAFAGLTANAPWWDVTLGVAMAMGRFLPIVAVLAIAGSLVGQAQAGPVGRHPAHRRRPVHRPAGRGDPDPGRPAILPRIGAGTDRRALPGARRGRTALALIAKAISR
jgi:K+-transporting ATPase ATPase A chain